jgi:hypothetical protein
MIAGEARPCGNTLVLSARGESVRACGKAGVSVLATQSMKQRKAPKVSELKAEMAKIQAARLDRPFPCHQLNRMDYHYGII